MKNMNREILFRGKHIHAMDSNVFDNPELLEEVK